MYFNNDYSGHAVANAHTLIELLGDAAPALAARPDRRRAGVRPRPRHRHRAAYVDPPERLTPFQHAVVGVVASLEAGQLLTYAEVATEAGHPGAAQAVANVLRRVPGLPWWRVVPQDGRLYRTHAPTQAPLLAAEGVPVGDDRTVTPG